MDYKVVTTNTRDEWLLARTQAITASEISILLNDNPVSFERVAESKRKPPAEITSRAMAFGHEREPYILEAIRNSGYDIVDNDQLLLSTDNDLHGATPDGLGQNKDADKIAEVKTTNKGWDTIPDNYYAQVQWQLHVTKARQCVFAWEVHDNYVPQQVFIVLIDRDEDFIAKEIEVAERFIEQYKPEPTVNDFLENILDRYAETKTKMEELDAELKKTREELVAFLGDEPAAYKGKSARFSYSIPKDRVEFDKKSLEKEHPEIFSQYTHIKTYDKPSLTVTLVRNKD